MPKRKRSESQSTTSTKKAKTQPTSATVAAIVKKEMRKKTDWKYTDTLINQGTCTSAGTMTSLFSAMARGDQGYNQFQGNEIMPQAILVKWSFATNQNYNACRIIIFQWFDTITPSVGNVIQNIAVGIAPYAPITISSKRDIKVLYDKTVIISPTAGDGTTVLGYGVSPVETVYIPGKRLKPTKFNPTNNTIVDGNIYCLVISDDQVLNYPLVTYYTRITYSDGA